MWLTDSNTKPPISLSRQAKHPLRLVDLSRCLRITAAESGDSSTHVFQLVSATNTDVFSADTRQDQQDWVNALKQVVTLPEGL